ncbi:MAG: cytidine deaminase [Syntrophotaleaceae bacterium]
MVISPAQASAMAEAARQACNCSYAPYSNFPVGAAVLTASGQIVTGCNVENASLGLSCCAERVALFNAVSQGARHIVALAIFTPTTTPTAPCGACRQVLQEFAAGETLPIFSVCGSAERLETTLAALLPAPSPPSPKGLNMPTCQPLYHIGFNRPDLGDPPPVTALLCGDPERSRQIAEQTAGVTKRKTLSRHRGLHSFLVSLTDGSPLLIATSGMGGPSLSIVVNELYQIGIRRIIRVGTCGAIADGIQTGSVVISRAALCRQGAADDIAPAEYPAAADPFLTVALVEAARTLEVPWHLGITASVDTFYEGQERTGSSANPHLLRRLQGITDEYRRLNILNYEMEAATLFKMAGVYGFAAGCVCGVLADRNRSEEVEIARKEQAVQRAIAVAVQAAGQPDWEGNG